MEIVNTTSVTPAQAVEFLIERDFLRRLIGTDACACFVVARSIHASAFHDRLIENITTIDSTTRDHIAFVVFYSESKLHARAGYDYDPWQCTEVRLSEFSMSRELYLRFDETYADLFRHSPMSIDSSAFAEHMASSTDALMRLFRIKEADLPCVVFVDPKNTVSRYTVSLGHPSLDPLKVLYFRVLAPLSDAFRNLEEWLSARRDSELKAERVEIRGDALNFLNLAPQRESILRSEAEEKEHKRCLLMADNWTATSNPRLVEAQAELDRIENELETINGRVSPAQRSILVTRLKKKQVKWRNSVLNFSNQAYREHLIKKLNLDELPNLLLEKERAERTLCEIPEAMCSSAGAAKVEFERLSRESRELGYDWDSVCRSWPRDLRSVAPSCWIQETDRPLWRRPLGPRTYGVITHVLERPRS